MENEVLKKFTTLTKKIFHFLENEYVCKDTKNGNSVYVEYINSNKSIVLSYGFPQKEVSLSFGSEGNFYSIGELLQTGFFTNWEWNNPNEETEIEKFLKEFARFTAENRNNIFNDDIIKKIELNRKLAVNEEKIKNSINKANKYWENKDYKKYFNLLNPIKENLSDSELKKLEYAKKHT